MVLCTRTFLGWKKYVLDCTTRRVRIQIYLRMCVLLWKDEEKKEEGNNKTRNTGPTKACPSFCDKPRRCVLTLSYLLGHLFFILRSLCFVALLFSWVY